MSNHEIEPPSQPLATRKHPVFRWKPQALSAPHVDPDLTALNTLERSAEVLRFSALRFEYWVSPTGVLREWLRLNLLVAAIVVVTGILVAPLLTVLLGEIADWVALVLQIVTGLLTIAAVAVASFILLRCIHAMRNASPGGRPRR